MSQPETTGGSPPKPRLRRRSRLAKLMMVIGVLSAAAVLCCCLSMLMFPLKVTTQPAEIEAIAREFGPLKLPAHFQGVQGMFADNAMMWVQIARFDHSEGRGKLIIGGAHLRTAFANEDGDALWLEWVINQLAPGIRLLDVHHKREKVIEIGGKQITFEIVDGEDRASTTRFKQVMATFPGPGGPAKLILQAEETFLDDPAIDELVESLSQPPQAHP